MTFIYIIYIFLIIYITSAIELSVEKDENLCSVFKRNVQLCLSNVFSMSNDTMIVRIWVCCERLKRLKSHCLLSEPCLFLIKPV